MNAAPLPTERSDRAFSRLHHTPETLTHPVLWPMYATLVASTGIVIGLIWDISWHRTVGRDTFWTYPHVLAQVAALISGLGCGWLVLHTTFSPSATAQRASAIKVWGFQGPLGAWVCIWGTVMMITSAPFDNWWHNAYGLDVTIISPPHTVLIIGMIAIELGALLSALAIQNRSEFGGSRRLSLPFAYGAGLIMCMIATILLEEAGFANIMHDMSFYTVTAWALPLPLLAFARSSSLRWPATTIAAVYMGMSLALMWTLEHFAATPKLAPIYNPVTHMVPPPFPYLLIVPAFAVDLLMHRFGRDRDWRLSIAVGKAFLAIFFLIQWFFSAFLLSPHAHNALFAAGQWDYNIRPGSWETEFWGDPALFNIHLIPKLFITSLYAILSARAGLWLGTLMRKTAR